MWGHGGCCGDTQGHSQLPPTPHGAHTHPQRCRGEGLGTPGVESPLWRGQLRRVPPFPAHFPGCLTVFPANYPALLRARAAGICTGSQKRPWLLGGQQEPSCLPGFPRGEQGSCSRRDEERCQPRCRLRPGVTVTPPRPPALPPCTNSQLQPWKSFPRSFPPRFCGGTALSQVWLRPCASCAMGSAGRDKGWVWGPLGSNPGGGIAATVTPRPPCCGERRSREEGDTGAAWDGSPWEQLTGQPRAP